MLSTIALAALCRAAPAATHAPVARAAVARCARRFASAEPFAVDAPDGDHDLQDLEESSDWAKRTIAVAAVTKDADAITEMHDAVLGQRVFAVDGPDGEHDLEDVEEHLTGVKRIIDQASVLEDPDKIKEEQRLREEMRKKSYNPDAAFYNAKY